MLSAKSMLRAFPRSLRQPVTKCVQVELLHVLGVQELEQRKRLVDRDVDRVEIGLEPLVVHAFLKIPQGNVPVLVDVQSIEEGLQSGDVHALPADLLLDYQVIIQKRGLDG